MSTATTSKAEGVRERPAYARLGVYGIGLIATAVLVFAAIAASTSPDELAFILPILAVALLIAGLAWRFGTWAKILAIVGCVAFAIMLFWVVFGLAHPASPADFMIGLLVPTGVVLGIAGNALAIRHRREPVAQAVPRERRIVVGVTALMLVAAAGSTVTYLTQRSTVDLPDGVPVAMSGFAFPDVVEAASGATLVVHNSDGAVHDFTVPALDLGVNVLPGSDGVIDLTGAAPGTYTVYCTLHANTGDPDPETAGMATSLVVTGS
jgi:plastocyanin